MLDMVLSGKPAVLVDADVDKVHVHNHDMGIRTTEVAHLRVGFVGLLKLTNAVVVLAKVVVPHLRKELLADELVLART